MGGLWWRLRFATMAFRGQEELETAQKLAERAKAWGLATKGLTRNLGHGAPTTMVKILLWVYAFGGSFTLEHPRGDSEGSMRWSIWRSAFMKQLLQAADMKLITFLQGPLGQCFPKPTTLLAARLPGLAEQLFSEYDLTWRAMEWLGGKTGNVWRTAKAKVYPMKLCKVLAAAHMQHASTLCLRKASNHCHLIFMQSWII